MSNQPASHAMSRRKPVIYVVDDEQMTRDLLAGFLEADYKVATFSSAQAALDIIKNEVPDAIVSDLHMPEMDGAALRKEITKLPQGDVIPFVFLSANEEAAQDAYYANLGIDDFLTKPIDADRLIRVLSRLLNRARQLHVGHTDLFKTKITELLHPKTPDWSDGWRGQVFSKEVSAGGGDFICLITPDSGYPIYVFGDVMGHGLEAKAYAACFVGYLRAILWSLAKDHRTPAEILHQLSRFLDQDSLLQDILVSLVLIQLDPNGTVTLSAAGHPDPLLLDYDKQEISHLSCSGPVPGLAGEANLYHNITVQLGPEKVLFLFSDGFFSSRDWVTETSSLKEKLDSFLNIQVDEVVGSVGILHSHLDKSGLLSESDDDRTVLTLSWMDV